jgi:hypothetical protein
MGDGKPGAGGEAGAFTGKAGIGLGIGLGIGKGGVPDRLHPGGMQ